MRSFINVHYQNPIYGYVIVIHRPNIPRSHMRIKKNACETLPATFAWMMQAIKHVRAQLFSVVKPNYKQVKLAKPYRVRRAIPGFFLTIVNQSLGRRGGVAMLCSVYGLLCLCCYINKTYLKYFFYFTLMNLEKEVLVYINYF